MAYPGRQNIYEATIRRMVQAALDEQEQLFRQQHEADTDAQLITYLCSCAAQLQHTPWPGEIVGGAFIKERFGTDVELVVDIGPVIGAHAGPGTLGLFFIGKER